MSKISNEYKASVLTKNFFLYLSEPNFEWIREQVFKHNTKISYFVNAVIEDARKSKPIVYNHDDYKKVLYQQDVKKT